MQLILRDKKLPLNRPLIMGILNVTPDSFSDGGRYATTAKAVKRAFEMDAEGADIIDIGGESSRPGSLKISPREEIRRVVPVIEKIREKNRKIPVSVDTYKPEVAEAALKAGADMINDITGGVFDPRCMELAAKYGAGYVIMHMQGTPENMQKAPRYSKKGVVSNIKSFLKKQVKAALRAGIKKQGLVIDPGIGFGKTLRHNFEIIDSLGAFCRLGLPVLAGASRKSMIGKVLGLGPDERLFGTAATTAVLAMKGASIIRVHDVREMKETALMAHAMANFR